MRMLPSVAVLAAVVACHDVPTALYDHPADPAPSGLPVTLTISPSTSVPFSGPAIAAAGDSVVVAAEYLASGCFDYSASGGVIGGNTLVITITESTPPTTRYCTMDYKTAVYRAVVRPAPRGSYPVVLRRRIESSTDGPRERELARGSASLP
jgi:hypothetical protein